MESSPARIAMYSWNKFKPGLLGANCSSGRFVTAKHRPGAA